MLAQPNRRRQQPPNLPDGSIAFQARTSMSLHTMKSVDKSKSISSQILYIWKLLCDLGTKTILASFRRGTWALKASVSHRTCQRWILSWVTSVNSFGCLASWLWSRCSPADANQTKTDCAAKKAQWPIATPGSTSTSRADSLPNFEKRKKQDETVSIKTTISIIFVFNKHIKKYKQK